MEVHFVTVKICVVGSGDTGAEEEGRKEERREKGKGEGREEEREGKEGRNGRPEERNGRREGRGVQVNIAKSTTASLELSSFT